MTRFHRLLPYVALAPLAVTGVALVGLPSSAASSGGAARSVRVEASTFAFAPATIEVDPGDRVTIELASADVVHGLHIEGYNVNLTADPGQPASATFIADRPGTFSIRCSVPCRALHPFMSGRVRVGPPSTFWRAITLAFLAVAVGGIALWRKPSGPGARLGPA